MVVISMLEETHGALRCDTLLDDSARTGWLAITEPAVVRGRETKEHCLRETLSKQGNKVRATYCAGNAN
jgi:hypothetical protein